MLTENKSNGAKNENSYVLGRFQRKVEVLIEVATVYTIKENHLQGIKLCSHLLLMNA